MLRTSALAGNGIANLPTFLVGPDIEAGRLVPVLPDNPPTELGIFALYAPNRYLAAKTRVFIDFLVARFGEEPRGTPSAGRCAPLDGYSSQRGRSERSSVSPET